MSLASIGKRLAGKYAERQGSSTRGFSLIPDMPADNKHAAAAFATPTSQKSTSGMKPGGM
jgi:hypothetical protein